mgnify:FL=1
MIANDDKSKMYVFVLSVLLFTSCLKNVEEDDAIDNSDNTTQVISFAKNVKPIIEVNCVGCHGGTYPNLETFNSIVSNSAIVREQVVSRKMPIGNILTPDEINTIVNWIDAGALDN